MALSKIPVLDDLLNGTGDPIGSGSDPEAVGAVQDLLFGQGQPGMPGLASDARGIYGPRTTKAVVSFRRKNGLEAHTTVDQDALQQLIEVFATRPLASQAYLTLALDQEFTPNLKLVSIVARLCGAGLFAQTLPNPDTAGLSFGMLPWSQKGGLLHDLLTELTSAHRDAMQVFLGADQLDDLITFIAGPSFGMNPDGTSSDATGRFNLLGSHWVKKFHKVGLIRLLQSVQVVQAKAFLASALTATILPSMARLSSERGVAFALDLILQFGADGAKALYAAAEPGAADQAALLTRLRNVADATLRTDFPDLSQVADEALDRRDFLARTALLTDLEFLPDGAPDPTTPPMASFSASRAASYFLLPRPSQHLLPPVVETQAAAFIGGRDGLAAMKDAILAANASGDVIYMLNWHVEHTLNLVKGDDTSKLGALLQTAAANSVQIRSMMWEGPTFLPTAGLFYMIVVSVIAPELLPLILGIAFLDRLLSAWITQEARVNKATADFLNGLTGDARAILDGERGLFGTHHQKLLVVRAGGTLTAFVGGTEYNTDRLDNDPNHASGSPLFDTTVQLKDRAAWLALNTFIDRWKCHPKSLLPGADLVDPGPMPSSTGGTLMVQFTHTYGRGYSPRDFGAPVWTASDAISNGICNAKTFFYIEDQYFVGSRKLGTAICQAFRRSPGLIGVVVMASEQCLSDFDRSFGHPAGSPLNQFDPPPNNKAGYRRRAFIRPIMNLFPNRLLVFNRLGPFPPGGTPSLVGDSAYVHSKLVIVDDEAAFVGSVNANQRSWYHDSEVDATFVDANGPGTTTASQGWVRDLRCRLWQEHFAAPCDGDPRKDLETWKILFRHGIPPSGALFLVSPYDAFVTPPPPLAPAESGWYTMYDPL